MALVDREIDPEVQHILPFHQQNGVGVADTPPKITRYKVSRDKSSLQTSRDIGSPQTNKDVGSCITIIKIITDVGSVVNKDDLSSVGELF